MFSVTTRRDHAHAEKRMSFSSSVQAGAENLRGGRQGLCMARKISKNLAKARALVEPRPYTIGDAIPLLQKAKYAKFDEDRRSDAAAWCGHPSCGPDGTRDRCSSPRSGWQEQSRGSDRLWRQAARGRSGWCGVCRRRRPGGAHPEGKLDRLRRADRDAGHDAVCWPSGKGPWTARA